MLIPDSEISPCLSALVTRKRKNQFEKSGNELSIYPLHSQGWISIIFQRSVAVGSRTVAIRDLHRTDVGVILIDTVCFINRARIIGLKGSRYKFSMKFSCCVDAFIIVHPARRSRVNLLRVCNTHPYTKWRKKMMNVFIMALHPFVVRMMMVLFLSSFLCSPSSIHFLIQIIFYNCVY